MCLKNSFLHVFIALIFYVNYVCHTVVCDLMVILPLLMDDRRIKMLVGGSRILYGSCMCDEHG